MRVTALVMAGGKGTRMLLSEEKPMLQVSGKPIIEHVLTSLKNAKKIRNIVVAVSNYTPKTANFMRKFPVSIIKTPGKEYVSDMGYAIRSLQLQTVLAIGADLPLITPKVIDTIIECYEQCGKSALSVVVPMETKIQLGLAGKYGFKFNGKIVVPAGINLINGCKIDEEEIDEKIYVLDRKEVALNINTVQELQIAENLFKKYSNTQVHGHIT